MFDTIEEAKNRSEFVKKIDNKFNIYIAQVGCWCPWSPNPDCLENQEYAETQLNTLMKEYKKNMNDKDVVFESRKASLFPAATVTDTADTTVTDTTNIENETVGNTEATESADTVVVAANDDPDAIEMSELKTSIEQVDTWSAQKLGIQ